MTADQLTIRELIGQLMMPMLPDTADLKKQEVWEQAQADLENFAFGGYIVFRGDATETPRYLEDLQAQSEVPLLVASDMERGAGQQLAGLTRFPFPMALGAARDPDLAFQQGAITALEARRAGIHWVFAPTVDLAGRPENPIISVRGFGDEPRPVGMLASAFVGGVQRHGAIACAKHFPGHGETSVDSHETLPVVDVSRMRLESMDLVPFRDAIRQGVKSVMIGHLAVPALDETGLPASMSKRIVTDLLREQLGFTGLVVTDALMMGAVTERFEPGAAAVRALQAGCDVLLMPPDPAAVVTAVLRALEEGALTRSQLLAAATRVMDAKAELGLWENWDDEAPLALPDYGPAVAAIAEGATTLVHDEDGLLPLSPDRPVAALLLDDDAKPELVALWREATAGYAVDTRVVTPESGDAEIEEAVAWAAGHGTVVVPVFFDVKAWKNRMTLHERLAPVPEALRAAGARVVAVSFSSPFLVRQFPRVEAYVCAYAPDLPSQRAAAQAVWGALPFRGRLPVDLAAQPRG